MLAVIFGQAVRRCQVCTTGGVLFALISRVVQLGGATNESMQMFSTRSADGHLANARFCGRGTGEPESLVLAGQSRSSRRYGVSRYVCALGSCARLRALLALWMNQDIWAKVRRGGFSARHWNIPRCAVSRS